jgi:hypothetical protein
MTPPPVEPPDLSYMSIQYALHHHRDAVLNRLLQLIAADGLPEGIEFCMPEEGQTVPYYEKGSEFINIPDHYEGGFTPADLLAIAAHLSQHHTKENT